MIRILWFDRRARFILITHTETALTDTQHRALNHSSSARQYLSTFAWLVSDLLGRLLRTRLRRFRGKPHPFPARPTRAL